jgi:hypothetical protein
MIHMLHAEIEYTNDDNIHAALASAHVSAIIDISCYSTDPIGSGPTRFTHVHVSNGDWVSPALFLGPLIHCTCVRLLDSRHQGRKLSYNCLNMCG